MKHMFGCDTIKPAGKHSMTKADIRLFVVILATSFLILLFFRLHRTQGGYAEISYDGMVLMQLPLSQSEGKCYLLKEPQMDLVEIRKEEGTEWTEAIQLIEERKTGSYNIFLCQGGEIRMLESNCPDQDCVSHRAIFATGEAIICLPHKVVIEIIDGKGPELDGVVY